MEHVYYLTKICYASLGMKWNITKELRSIPKEKENHHKAIRIKKECSSRKTACPR